MEPQASKSLHPLIWVAGIALILFSAVGISAFMGWIPTSIASPGETAATGSQSAYVIAPAPTTEKSQTGHIRHTAPIQLADGSSGRTRNRCGECGVVETVREVETKGQGSGLGAVGGGVVGGLLGHQLGGGRGQDAMTVVGVVGGAMAGNEVEKRSKSTRSYAIAIRLDDGSSRTINEANAPQWRAGDRVKVVNGTIQFNN